MCELPDTIPFLEANEAERAAELITQLHPFVFTPEAYDRSRITEETTAIAPIMTALNGDDPTWQLVEEFQDELIGSINRDHLDGLRPRYMQVHAQSRDIGVASNVLLTQYALDDNQLEQLDYLARSIPALRSNGQSLPLGNLMEYSAFQILIAQKRVSATVPYGSYLFFPNGFDIDGGSNLFTTHRFESVDHEGVPAQDALRHVNLAIIQRLADAAELAELFDISDSSAIQALA